MPPDEVGGQGPDQRASDYAVLRIAGLWWLRGAAATLVALGSVMHELEGMGFLDVLVMGIVVGIFLDRFVLWPLAVLIARLDGRFRPR